LVRWIDPIDVYYEVACVRGLSVWYHYLVALSFAAEQIWTVLLLGHCSFNFLEWVVTPLPAKQALERLFLNGTLASIGRR
jgi:hypothetical protein